MLILVQPALHSDHQRQNLHFNMILYCPSFSGTGMRRSSEMTLGLRMLAKSPGWTVVMCATLALGIGLSTAIFSLAYSLLFCGLPYADSGRLSSFPPRSPAAASASGSRWN